MSSEIYLSRVEIRRQILAELGMWTNANAASDAWEQITALIDSAALKVAAESREWLSLQRRSSVGLDEGEDLITYTQLAQAYAWERAWPNDYVPRTYGTEYNTWTPPEVLPLQIPRGDGILLAARLDSTGTSWTQLRRYRLGMEEDQSWQTTHVQAVADEGGDADAVDAAANLVANQRSTPYWYDVLAAGVMVYPRPDERTVFRVEFTVNPAWGQPTGTLSEEDLDNRASIVDAELIVHYVCARMRAHQGDTSARDEHMQAFRERLAAIRGWQTAGNTWDLDRSMSFDDMGKQALPNWDLGPVVR